ncbi:MAG: ribbon-helix-helix protein, CopG family [Nitrospirota bacterium]
MKRRLATPRYTRRDQSRYIRLQILVSREDYEGLTWWRGRTGNPRSVLIREAIARALVRERRRLGPRPRR